MLIVDDCRAALKDLADIGTLVDAVVTDPPYHLESVVKRFGKEGSAPAKRGSDGLFQRQSKGFMGKEWDGGGIAFDPEMWRLIWEVMKPGAYMFAFGGSRTGHRMACAIEDAGFIMHPFFGWVYSTGFPKATNPEKALAARGAENEWGGWRHGTQSFKPALEPIFLAQKPISEPTMADNLLKWGVGCVNIDAGRVDSGDVNPSIARRKGAVNHLSTRPARETEAEGRMVSRQSPEAYRAERAGELLGRWPANLIHDGSDEVVAMFPESKGQQGDVRGTEPSRTGDENTVCYGEFGRVPFVKRADSGSAARFFNATPFDEQERLLYCAKPRKGERGGTKHPTIKPLVLMRLLCRLVTPPGGTVLDPFAGSGTTGRAAIDEGFDVILIEREAEYAGDIRNRVPECV